MLPAAQTRDKSAVNEEQMKDLSIFDVVALIRERHGYFGLADEELVKLSNILPENFIMPNVDKGRIKK